MKIAQVSHGYVPHIGGIEEHVRNICERLVHEHDVTVLTTESSGKLPKEEIIGNVTVLRFNSWAPHEAYHFSGELKNYLMEHSNDYDIVHAHNYHAFPALYAAQSKCKNALVFTSHYLGKGQSPFRNLLHMPYKLLSIATFKKSDRVICVSKYEKKMVSENFPITDEKVCIIPNGVNIDEIKGYKWNPDLTHPKIVYAGRLEKQHKNLDKLICSLRILANEYGINSKLAIIGTGPYEDNMLKLIRKLGLQDNVILKHWLPREQYLKELASGNVFVMPSDNECFGISAAEAIVMGVPTVVTDSTALSEYVEKGLALGIEIPITPSSIAKGLYDALMDPDVLVDRDYSDKIVSWDNVTGQLTKLYEDVINHQYKENK